MVDVAVSSSTLSITPDKNEKQKKNRKKEKKMETIACPLFPQMQKRKILYKKIH